MSIETEVPENAAGLSQAPESGPGVAGDAPAEAPRIFERRFNRVGLLVAGLFLAASMFPSLLPRASWAQGLIIGITVALG